MTRDAHIAEALFIRCGSADVRSSMLAMTLACCKVSTVAFGSNRSPRTPYTRHASVFPRLYGWVVGRKHSKCSLEDRDGHRGVSLSDSMDAMQRVCYNSQLRCKMTKAVDLHGCVLPKTVGESLACLRPCNVPSGACIVTFLGCGLTVWERSQWRHPLERKHASSVNVNGPLL
jgi:hypothetical protein